MPLHDPETQTLSTLPIAFLQDWFDALDTCCGAAQTQNLQRQAGISNRVDARVSRDQIVMLYQLAALESGDEMMGLWSRPIRAGALKQLCTVVMAGGNLGAAMYRFTQFWNLLLDDYALALIHDPNGLRITLHMRQGENADAQRFGHMLMLKLTHGVASWLAGQELPLSAVNFQFPAPEFAADYAVLFPAPVQFDAPHSEIVIAPGFADLPITPGKDEMDAFLQRAPRDWIFTQSVEHSLVLKIRGLIDLQSGKGKTLDDIAGHLNLTPRTLMRRLEAEGTSFQEIKDGLRRDIALAALRRGSLPIEAIAQDVGFSSVASFHRAFKRWTGQTPADFRRSQ